MTICSRCKTENNENSKFCCQCGNDLTVNVDAPANEDLKSLADSLNEQAAYTVKKPFNLNKAISEFPKKIWLGVRNSIFFRKKKNTIITFSILVGVPLCVFAFLTVFNKVIIPNNEYKNAMDLMNSGNYEEALVVLEGLDGYKDSDEQITNCNNAILDEKYSDAVALMEEQKYEEAISAFRKLNGHKDSLNQIDKAYIAIYGEEIYDKIKNVNRVSVGDSYKFGSYEQDNNTGNGKEKIEWIVLDKNGDSLLLISNRALDCQPYHSSRERVTWENCSLRKWLNEAFYNTAFNSNEQKIIASTTVSPHIHPSSMTRAYQRAAGVTIGNSTNDKVFLLSAEETEKYFPSSYTRKCMPTEYAIAKGAFVIKPGGMFEDDVGCGSWLLRTPGWYQDTIAGVNTGGDFSGYTTTGYYVDDKEYGIRPALWLSLKQKY